MSSSARIKWVDMTKGIAILLVIVAHTSPYGSRFNFLKQFIYSFHMPLFFIMSSFTTKYSPDIQTYKRKAISSIQRLLLPAVFIICINFLISDLMSHTLSFNFEIIKPRFLSVLFSSVSKVELSSMTVPRVGRVWFLFALFTGKLIYDALQLSFDRKQTYFLTGLLSLVGISLRNANMIFCLDIALVIQPIFLFGDEIKQYPFEKNTILKFLKVSILWSILAPLTFFPDFSKNYFDIALKNYPYYPICFVVGILGTLCVVEFCVLTQNIKVFSSVLAFLGKHSLILFLVHCIDDNLKNIWGRFPQTYVDIILRILLNLFIFIIVFLITEGYRVLTARLQKQKQKA